MNSILTNAAFTDIIMARDRDKLDQPGTTSPASLQPDAKIRVGNASVPGNPVMQYVFAFEFPVLPSGVFVSKVILGMDFVGINQTDGKISHNADLWITGHVSKISEAAPWYLGPANVAPGAAGPDGTNLVQAGFLTPKSKPGGVTPNDAGAEVLKNSVNAFLAAVDGQGYAGGKFLCFRLNCDRLPTGGETTSGYQLFCSEGVKPPSLGYTIG